MVLPDTPYTVLTLLAMGTGALKEPCLPGGQP